jgi:alpha-ribazole phosphatase
MSGFVLHLLRHGAPERTGCLLGRTDWASTQEGVAACVEQAGDLDVAHIVSSDLWRARAAGEALAAAYGRPLAIDPRWRELDFGAWDGQPASALDAALLARFWDDPDAAPPPGGERWSALVARVRAALEDLVPEPTLVVTHGGAMRAALAGLCGFALPQLWAFDLPYASLLSLRVWREERMSAQIIGLWP